MSARTATMTGLSLLAATGCAAHHLVTPPAERATDSTWLEQVYVLDVEHGERSGPLDVLLADGVIQALEPAGESEPPEGATVVEGEGRTLMPGLVDAHVHIAGGTGAPPWRFEAPDPAQQLESLLYCGVTTVVSAADSLGAAGAEKKLEGGRLSGPRMLRASRTFTAPGGHPEPMIRMAVPWPFAGLAVSGTRVTVPNAADAAGIVDHEIHRTHPDLIKIIYDAIPADSPHLTPEELQAIVDRARERGIHPVVHVGDAAEAVAAAESGAWLLMHTPWEDRLTDDDVERIRRSGVPVVTTARVNDVLVTMKDGAPEWNELELATVSDEVRESFDERPPQWRPAGFMSTIDHLEEYSANQHANVKALYDAGVPLITGTDSGIPGMFFGSSLHRELQTLVEAGIPAADVLRMATVAPVRLLYPDDRSGVVEKGARADVILVEGNPLDDITATRRIVGVWQAGRRVR